MKTGCPTAIALTNADPDFNIVAMPDGPEKKFRLLKMIGTVYARALAAIHGRCLAPSWRNDRQLVPRTSGGRPLAR